jgi:hypothetical protein
MYNSIYVDVNINSLLEMAECPQETKVKISEEDMVSSETHFVGIEYRYKYFTKQSLCAQKLGLLLTCLLSLLSIPLSNRQILSCTYLCRKLQSACGLISNFYYLIWAQYSRNRLELSNDTAFIKTSQGPLY